MAFRLKRLKINKFRNIRPGCELHFSEGTNVILGLNGSGKSTLLGILAGLFTSKIESIGNGDNYDIEADMIDGNQKLLIKLSRSSVSTMLSKQEKSPREMKHIQAKFQETTIAGQMNCIGNGSKISIIIENDIIRIINKDNIKELKFSSIQEYALPLLIWMFADRAEDVELKAFSLSMGLHLDSAFRFEEGLEALDRLTRDATWYLYQPTDNEEITCEVYC